MPPPAIRELRDLTRYRKALIQDRTREANRLHKVLQDAGIKLATVATDILGVSGRAMLTALVAGTTDAAVLEELFLEFRRERGLAPAQSPEAEVAGRVEGEELLAGHVLRHALLFPAFQAVVAELAPEERRAAYRMIFWNP